MTFNMLKAQSLNISYDHKKILDDFKIDVEKGEIVSIIGPNGSGKSDRKSTRLNSSHWE